MEEEGIDPEACRRFGDRLVAHVRDGVPLDPLTSERERALLVYALRLTRDPQSMSRADVDALRAAGLDDGEILDANQVTAYFAYANRVADGLGIELESWHR